jgi:hypothetical protein
MLTDLEIEEMIKVSSVVGTRSYVEVVPAILAELLRLRRKVRETEIERATEAVAGSRGLR